MSKRMMISLAVAIVLVMGVGVFIYKDQLFPKAQTQANQSSLSGNANTASATYKEYAALEGDKFDRSFIANMIAHHDGAVDMAKSAQKNAKHQELKDMANNIIASQDKEILDMKNWQKKWGYPSTSADNMMDHSAMGMMGDMSGMMMELDGKTGDEYDKAFIEQMTEHHQSAIDMAAPGLKNAKHQEIKDLIEAIIEAQSKEIAQMQQWQKDWGY